MPHVSTGTVGLALCVLLLCACDEREIPCPDAWEDSQPSDHGCVPPEEVADDAQKLGTGIFGYARDCAPEAEELAGCVPGELVGSCAFWLIGVDEAGTQQDRVRVVVEADSTFEQRLTPGLTYTAEAIYGHLGPDGLTLEDGEVRYVQFYGSCE